MALRKIITEGDPVLGKVCHPVEKFDAKLHNLIDDMRDTLIDSNGVGLAAPQVGILRRVVLVMDAEENIIELVNPTIIALVLGMAGGCAVLVLVSVFCFLGAVGG